MFRDMFEELETERLILRKIVDSDAEMLYNNIYNNYEWYKFYCQFPFNSFEEYRVLVGVYKELYLKGNYFRWGIVEKKSNEIIGLVQLHSKDSLNNNCKIGYIISYNYNKMGYAKEAVEKVLEFGFQKVNYHRIEANIVVENLNSIKLAENVGMTYESTKKECYKLGDDYYDQKVYVLLNSHKNN